MDNENNNVVEETARPVKKLVLKRKPVIKKTPKVKDTETEQETAAAPVPAAKQETAAEQAPSEEESTPSQKKRRGRPPKKNEDKKAKTQQPELISESASAPEPDKTEKAEQKENEVQETKAAPEAQKPESQKEEEQEQKRFNNRNQNQHNNNQKNKNKFNNNGKQDQRNNQKKPLTMEDLAISDAEYQEHLSHRLIVSDVVSTPVDELKERLSQMEGTSVDDYAEYKKQEVIVELLKAFSRNGGVIYATGTLEILSDGYGFLRSPLNSYLSGPEDVYVSAGIIKFQHGYNAAAKFVSVIDEMLAYLKGRSGSDKLNRDLQVLQALAHVANSTKFRIAFGVQEAIYSAAEFQFAREMLLHVNDRYRSLTITKEDVKYIAQKRMLRKDDGQRQQVRGRNEHHNRTHDRIDKGVHALSERLAGRARHDAVGGKGEMQGDAPHGGNADPEHLVRGGKEAEELCREELEHQEAGDHDDRRI